MLMKVIPIFSLEKEWLSKFVKRLGIGNSKQIF
jgi:hypothetical protein